MNRVPDISHQRVIRALRKAGFEIKRQGRHISMHRQDWDATIIIPRQHPLRRATLRAIIRDAGLTLQEFNDLL